MSAQAGIFNKDLPHYRTGEIEALLGDGNAPFGADRPGRLVDTHVSILHWAQWFDSLSRRERQPRLLESGVVVTFDGRLDNRGDLALQLRDALDDGPRSPDVDIVAAAYDRWGPDAFGRLDGDWAIVVYERENRTLTLARDYMGVRPLYYSVDGKTILWSTTFEPLVRCLRDAALDQDYLVAGLTFQERLGRTIYRNIRAVLPTTLMRFDTNGRVSTTRYWDPRNIARVWFRDRRDYAHALRDLFRQAVAVRLRADTPVACKLSGGYDSSAITCMAQQIVAAGDADAPTILPVSYIHDRSPESDERYYIAVVEAACGLTSILIRDEERVFSTSPEERQLDPFRRTERGSQLEAAVAPYNVKVVLSGEMGDLVMGKGSDNCSSLLEFLARGQIIQFWRQLADWAEIKHTTFPLALCRVLAHMQPSRMAAARRTRRLRSDLRKAYRTRTRNWADLFGLEPTLLVGRSFRARDVLDLRSVPFSKRWLVRQLMYFAGRGRIVCQEWTTTRSTHPFLHRPLVKFILGVPQTALWRPREERALMKEALASVLPAEIINRNSKGDPSPMSIRRDRAFAALLGEDTSDWEVVKRGIAQPIVLRQRLAEVTSGRIEQTLYLNRLFVLEAWLRGQHRSRVYAAECIPQAR